MYTDLYTKIQELLKNKQRVVVAISGHGGSGKSTLAERLARDFGVVEDQIVRSDGLHAKNYMNAKDIFEHHDWPVIMDILAHARTSRRLRYTKRDDKEQESSVDVLHPRLLIIEGIRLLRTQILPFVDISVWIRCPLQLATARAKARNRQQGDSQEDLALWDTKWVPESIQYVERVHPERLASFLYTEYR